MTETESNLMTQVLDLRREIAQLRGRCSCGWTDRTGFVDRAPFHAAHVAGEVAKALQLAEERLTLNEYAAANGATPEVQSRLVSPWVPVPQEGDR